MQFRHSQRGVTLIEMMIALVVGLIVSAAALALVASIVKSNTETIRTTRLTQELRSTAEVIARDLRRARSLTDPISNVGTLPLVSACNTIDVATAGCVKYAYDCTSATAGNFNAIDLAGGKVRLLQATASAPACPTTGTGTQISSAAVTITAMTFTQISTDAYQLSLTGTFASDAANTKLAALTRSITQEVRIRSPQVQ
jgi:prepilin-type N-terminal cleavage/methylation domain-containing protein